MKQRFLAVAALVCAIAMSHATTTPISQPRVSFVDGSGAPCAGCSLYSYLAGSTTPTPTYTDSTGGSQNTNPIVLDAAGGAQIWLGTSCYKFVLKDTGGTTLWTADNVCPVVSQGAPLSVTVLTTTQLNLTYTPAPGSTLQTTINTASANSSISLSCGTYTVGSGLTISSANVHLRGQSRDCTFINFTSAAGLSVSGTGVEVDGITFEGQTQWTVQATSAATGFRFHDNAVTQAGQGSSSFPLTPLWLQAGLNDAVVERNNFTGNGPASFSSGNAKGYTILVSGQTAGLSSNIRIADNRIWGNNNGIAISCFDCSDGIQITHNDVDENDVYDGSEGSGYAVMAYSEGYESSITSLGRTTNVVTMVVPAQPAGEPFTIGETVMLTGFGFGGNGSSFNGVFVLTGVSGTGPYTITWAQTAPDDTVTGGALAGVVQPPAQHLIIANNTMKNCAGACFYGQGLSDAVVASNEASNCDQIIVPSSLLHACYSFNGLWHGSITGNSADGAGHSSAYYLAHTYGVAFTGNVGVNAIKDGLRLGDTYDLAATGNTFAANTNGGIVGESTSTINSFHSTFGANDIYATTGSDCYHFAGLDQFDSVTGGECHAPPNGTGNAGFYALSTTSDITVTGLAVDCYADGGTVKGINYGLRAAGTRITMKSNKISGCAIDGILDVGTNDDAEGNNITASATGAVVSGSTGLTLKDNWLVGNTTAKTTAGATTLIDTGNVVTIGTLPAYQAVSVTFTSGLVLPGSFTGIQGNGVNIASATGSFTTGNLRKTVSGGAEADTALVGSQVPGLVIDCTTTATCNNSIPTNPWFTVGGPIAMSGGTITISAIAPAYTSTSTYRCFSWDVSSPSNATACSKVTGASITITGTSSDTVSYLLIGN